MNKVNFDIKSKHKNIIADSWLKDILQRQVYKIIINDSLVKEIKERRDTEYCLLQIMRTRPLFLYAKVPTVSLASIRFLEENGFHLIDTNIVFEKTASLIDKRADNCELRFATAADEAQVVELARRSFVYSRFHLDQAFSIETANTIKAEWAHNFFLGRRGEAMVAALIDKSIVGFLQLLQSDDGILSIDQIAVAKNFRRQGIASDMITYAQTYCKNIRQLRVGTQVANIASMRLYERMNFKISETKYIFHYHNS